MKTKLFFALALPLLFSACSMRVVPLVALAYEGEARPSSEVATLSSSIVNFNKIDGVSVDNMRKTGSILGSREFQLLPGAHTLELCFRLETAGSVRFCNGFLTAPLLVEPGYDYFADFVENGRRGWGVDFKAIPKKPVPAGATSQEPIPASVKN